MAQEWYILNSNHDTVSGFESDDFENYAEDGFLEALQGSIGTEVEICNFDLSEQKTVRAIVQNCIQDTMLKTLVRHLYVPIGTCKSGMYVKYKNRFWLITGLVDDNKIFEKAVMTLCNYQLTWINEEGKIIQRWANIVSASQYNNGETSTRFNYYNFRSDQLMISIPNDRDSMMINTGVRFIIDNRCKYYEDKLTKTDCSNPVLVYQVTRSDSVLYNYVDSGYFEFMVTQDEQRETDGYYVVDNKGYWLCKEYAEKVNQNPILSSKIEYDDLDIYNGIDDCTFYAKFFDENGNEAIAYPEWEIRGDCSNLLNVKYFDDSICISANNKKLLNKSFELVLSADGYNSSSVIFNVKDFI